MTFALGSSITLTIALPSAGGAAVAAIFVRERPARESIPWRWAAAGAGAALGILLWRVAGTVQGDGLFHLARTRKLLELDELSLKAVGEFADASLHPGYAFPLWHGFLALIARMSGTDPEQVVLHLPSVLAIVAVVVAYEAGWALFRAAWAAGAVAGAQAAMICFAPGSGGAYAFLALPATSSRQLLVPAALALALSALHAPTRGLFASTAAAGLVLAVVHPTYAIFLWIPFVGFLLVRALWTRQDLRPGSVVLASLAVPAAFFLVWLLPIVADTQSVSPDRDEVERAFEQYPGQLDIRSETSYSLAPEVFTRSGPVAVAALLLIPLAAFAARRRWAAFAVGVARGIHVHARPAALHAPLRSRLDLAGTARRASSRLRSPSPVVSPSFPACCGPGCRRSRSSPAQSCSTSTPVTSTTPSTIPAPRGGVVRGGRLRGCARRRLRASKPASVEDTAGLAAALFLLPVVAVGLAKWSPIATPPLSLLSPGLVEYVRRTCRSDRSYRSGDELSDRRRARLRRGRAARPCRRHDGEPAARARARRS